MAAPQDKRVVTLAGAAALALGVFAPVLSAPVIGGIPLTTLSGVAAVCLVLVAVGAATIALTERWGLILHAGVIAGFVIFLALYEAQGRVNAFRDGLESDAGGFLGGLTRLAISSVRLEWGWVVLVGGALALLAASWIDAGEGPS